MGYKVGRKRSPFQPLSANIKTAPGKCPIWHSQTTRQPRQMSLAAFQPLYHWSCEKITQLQTARLWYDILVLGMVFRPMQGRQAPSGSIPRFHQNPTRTQACRKYLTTIASSFTYCSLSPEEKPIRLVLKSSKHYSKWSVLQKRARQEEREKFLHITNCENCSIVHS